MKSSFYPSADKTTQWWEKSFSRGYFTKIEKILLHTTETTGWPGYSAGAIAPTLTYNVATRQWRQHNYLDTSARALGDPDSTPVRENRDNIIQIEIVWYAAKIATLPDSAYEDLAAFIAYVRKEWAGPSLNYAAVGGPNDDVHMTSAEFDAFNGILGHANAPSPSTHWDPGKIDYARLVNFVRKLETPVVTPPPTDPNLVQGAPIANPNTWQIWNWDGIPAPASQASKNAFWSPSSYLKWGFETSVDTLEAVQRVEKKLDDLLAILKPPTV